MFEYFMNDFNELIVVRVLNFSFSSSFFQATECSFSGHIASDPESTVYISGCPEKESVDISLMSKKVDWTSHLLPYFSLLLMLNFSFSLFSLISFLSSHHPYMHSLSLSPVYALFPIPTTRIRIIPNSYNPDAIMICFQSKLHFNTYRLEKAGRTWIIIFLDVCSQTLKVVFFTA